MLWRLLSAALLAAALASAQRGGGRGGEEGAGGGEGMRSRGPSKFDQFVDKMKLNGDQRNQARAIIMDAAKETGPLQEQLMKVRESLAGAYIAGNSQQADQALAQYTPLVAQLAGIEAKSFAKICALLKPNQQAKAGPAFELLFEVYEPVPNQNQGRGGRRGER